MDPAGSTFWLASYPRSGNTFARFLLKNYFAFNTPSRWRFEAPIDCPLTTGLNEDVPDRVTFAKTHEVIHDRRPALVLLRDGRDALVSHVHYQRDFWGWSEPFPDLLDRAIDPNEDFCGNWSAFYRHWLDPSAGRTTAQLSFEDLIANPLPAISAAVATLLNHPPQVGAHQELPPFSRFHAQNPRFFRRGYPGYWRREMSSTQQEAFIHYHGEVLLALGYEQ